MVVGFSVLSGFFHAPLRRVGERFAHLSPGWNQGLGGRPLLRSSGFVIHFVSSHYYRISGIVSPPSGLWSIFFLLTPGFTRGHNCEAQFGPFGCYNSNCDKNSIEVILITCCIWWLDSQIRRILTIVTPGATGGMDSVWFGKSAAADATSIAAAYGGIY